jgi:glycosyltransferase involved in cell wall biosynthesis
MYFFDDSSSDGSAEIAKQFDWVVIKNEKNLGHGGNLKKALQTAFKDGADYAVEIHADGQYPPNEIIKAKQKLSDNYDLIIGSRFQNKNPFLKDGMPFIRYATNKLMSSMTNFLCGIKLTEFHTGYKIFSKNFCEKAPYQKNSDNYLFSFEVILQASFFKLKYGEISISSTYEEYRQSCGYFDGLIYLLGNFKLIMLFFLAKLNIFKYKLFK